MPQKSQDNPDLYKDSFSPSCLLGEKDACGVGFIANIEAKESNWILQQSLKGLNCMEHRGGCGGDSDSGDGAGILCSIPWSFLEKVGNLNSEPKKDKGLGMIFMPNDPSEIRLSQSICDNEASKLKFDKTIWREVPVNNDQLGPLAKANAPYIMQWILYIDSENQEDIEFLLFQLRKRIEKKN